MQVRFYDDTGVIRRPSRAANGYRDFSAAEVERLVLVRRLRELDLPLDEIREIASFCFDDRCDLMNERLRETLLARRAELDHRRRELDGLAGQFDDLLDRFGRPARALRQGSRRPAPRQAGSPRRRVGRQSVDDPPDRRKSWTS